MIKYYILISIYSIIIFVEYLISYIFKKKKKKKKKNKKKKKIYIYIYIYIYKENFQNLQ